MHLITNRGLRVRLGISHLPRSRWMVRGAPNRTSPSDTQSSSWMVVFCTKRSDTKWAGFGGPGASPTPNLKSNGPGDRQLHPPSQADSGHAWQYQAPPQPAQQCPARHAVEGQVGQGERALAARTTTALVCQSPLKPIRRQNGSSLNHFLGERKPKQPPDCSFGLDCFFDLDGERPGACIAYQVTFSYSA